MSTIETLHASVAERRFNHLASSLAKQLKPILCGTDFSGPARAAADVAAAIAKRLGAPMRLVHIAEGPQSPAAQQELEAEARRIHATGVEVATELLDGVADEILVQLALQRDPRLVVVSSLGRRAPARWLLGSVAERIAESAPVPTLVVRDASPFLSWLSGERALKVFVGTDFTASSNAALDWVAELRTCGRCEVIAAYTAWTPEDASRWGALAINHNSPASEAALHHDIKAKVTRAFGEEDVRILVQDRWGRADAQLVEMAVAAAADIVVIGKHQRQGFARVLEGSVPRGILRYAPMSVACVPTPPAKRMAVPSEVQCRRVLVAVDVNEPHGFAAPYGYGICGNGGTVRLVHVVEQSRLPNPMIGGYSQDIPTRSQHASEVARCENVLRALAPGDAKGRVIATETEVIDRRDTAASLCDAAERFNSDVVCIGGHTRPGLRAKALGSVSLAVLQHCRRPVLIVWPPSG